MYIMCASIEMDANFLHTVIVDETKTICLTLNFWSLDLIKNVGVLPMCKSQCIESNIYKSRTQ